MNIQIGELIRLHSRLGVIKDNIDTNFGSVNRELNDIRINVQTSGLNENIIRLSEEISGVQNRLSIYLEKLLNFLYSQMESYKTTNEEARQTLENLITILTNGLNVSAVSNSVNMKGIDVSIYHSKPELGFVVTTGNKTYDLSDADYDFMCGIVASESDKSYDDSLAVASVILNRCEAPNWVYSHGTNPINQMKAPNQFEVYGKGYYKQYTNGNAPDAVKQAVSDALNGVRNCDYLSFRSNGSKNYSSNMITSTGNRYKGTFERSGN